MSILDKLTSRSAGKCELCGNERPLVLHPLPPTPNETPDDTIVVCEECQNEFNKQELNPTYWYCLKDSIWSEFTPVQVMAYRLLSRLPAEGWAQDLLSQVYLEDSVLEWAKADITEDEDQIVVKDSNGTLLSEGDSVTLIKDLVVKGANFTAKRGTMVKNIRLTDDPKLVEGRVNGTMIVLVAAYLKKN